MDEAYTGVYVKGFSLKKNVPEKKKLLCESMMKNEISYVTYFRERMKTRIESTEEPDEYLDDPFNDWEVASDLEHDPILSGADSSGSGESLTMERPSSSEREPTNP